MIIVSDNTATNLCIDLAGMDVAQTIHETMVALDTTSDYGQGLAS